MLKSLFILALSMMFLSCQEATIYNPYSHHQLMSFSISDALPVQFWTSDCDTYNEKEVCGIYKKCWCQPWECDDEIKIQFTDVSNSIYSLQILDENSNELMRLDFEETSISDTESIYSLSIVPSATSPDLCDKKIQLKIILSWEQDIGHSYEFPGTLSGWATESIGADWSGDLAYGGSAKVTLTGTRTKRFFVEPLTLLAKTYRVYFYFHYDSPTEEAHNISFTVSIKDSSFVELGQETITVGDLGNGYYSGFIEFDAATAVDVYRYQVQALYDDLQDDPVVYLLEVITLSELDSPTEVAKSDCLDIKTTQDCTQLLAYSNDRVFAGLRFSNSSPKETFYLRVPATFFHEKFPQEDEMMKLSQSTITLNGTLESQKLLQTDYIPNYMHRKILLILMMQTLEIDGQNWVKQEAYEIKDNGNRKYPLSSAKVFLNEADFVMRNVR